MLSHGNDLAKKNDNKTQRRDARLWLASLNHEKGTTEEDGNLDSYRRGSTTRRSALALRRAKLTSRYACADRVHEPVPLMGRGSTSELAERAGAAIVAIRSREERWRPLGCQSTKKERRRQSVIGFTSLLLHSCVVR